MTLYSEVVSKVKRMSRAEKLALLRVLADSLGDESSKQKRSKKALDFQPGRFKPTKDSSLFSVLGLCAMNANPPQTMKMSY